MAAVEHELPAVESEPVIAEQEDVVFAPAGLFVRFDTGGGETVLLRLAGWLIDKDGCGHELVEPPWNPLALLATRFAEAEDVAAEFEWEIIDQIPLWRVDTGLLFWGFLDQEHGPDVGPPYGALDLRRLNDAA